MAGRNFLFVPGPTNVPDRILRAMHRAMEDHRSSAFPDLPTGLFRDLKKLFKTTSGQPFIFPGSGTGACTENLRTCLYVDLYQSYSYISSNMGMSRVCSGFCGAASIPACQAGGGSPICGASTRRQAA